MSRDAFTDRTAELVMLDRARPGRWPRPARPRIGVLIADGQAVVRAGLRALLEDSERISVVGEAATGDDAVDSARRVRPDVVLIDAQLPGLGCVEVIGRILAQSSVAVMLLAASEHDECIFDSLRAGARGVVLKDSKRAELVRAVEVLAAGESLLAPSLTRRFIAELVSRPVPDLPSSELILELTAREREVVALVALGLTNGAIADQLFISPATAKTHVSRAMVKLHAHNRAQLVVWAYETGLVLPRVDVPALSRAS